MERFRFYKYNRGESYPEHMDGSYKRRVYRNGKQYQQQTFLTLLLYLNDDYEGGKTNFWLEKGHCRFLKEIELRIPSLSVSPKTGRCLLNIHNVFHEGSSVTFGTKYVIRTDIIFERELPLHQKIEKFHSLPKFEVSEWEKFFEPSCRDYHD